MTEIDTPACKCGLYMNVERDTRTCTHCDAAEVPCSKRCPRCARRDSSCVVCGVYSGTPAGAAAHEGRCRDAEAARERKAQP